MKTRDDLRQLVRDLCGAVEEMLDPVLTRVQLVQRTSEIQKMLEDFND